VFRLENEIKINSVFRKKSVQKEYKQTIHILTVAWYRATNIQYLCVNFKTSSKGRALSSKSIQATRLLARQREASASLRYSVLFAAAVYKQRVDNEAESIYKEFTMNEQEASVPSLVPALPDIAASDRAHDVCQYFQRRNTKWEESDRKRKQKEIKDKREEKQER
jgi:hypothetical protein